MTIASMVPVIRFGRTPATYDRGRYSLPEPVEADGLVLVQYLYCDESGKAPKDEVVSCCGFLLGQEHIYEFSTAWNQYAEAYWSVPPIHMRSINHPTEKNGWAQVKARWGDEWESNCQKMLEGFAEIVQRSLLQAFGSVVETAHFGGEAHAGQFAFSQLVSRVLQHLGTGGPGIGIVVDDDYEDSIRYHGWVRELRRKQSALGRTIKSLCFSADEGFPLIQAADMLAYYARERQRQPESASVSRIYQSLTKTPVCADRIEFLDAAKLAQIDSGIEISQTTDTKKPDVQELIAILKADPDRFYHDIVGLPRLTPEQRAELEKDNAPLDYDAIRDEHLRRLGRGGKTGQGKE
jgi:hypothetical protein